MVPGLQVRPPRPDRTRAIVRRRPPNTQPRIMTPHSAAYPEDGTRRTGREIACAATDSSIWSISTVTRATAEPWLTLRRPLTERNVWWDAGLGGEQARGWQSRAHHSGETERARREGPRRGHRINRNVPCERTADQLFLDCDQELGVSEMHARGM